MENQSRGPSQATSSDRCAVDYLRVSTHEQTEGFSLQVQSKECRNYAAQRGYTIVEEFCDDYTGQSLDRPGLNQLREFVQSDRRISAVIVHDIDRLARASVVFLQIEAELRRLGIMFEYVRGQYDDTDEGRLQKHIFAGVAEYDRAKILRRSKEAKRQKAQEGSVLVAARPPYGYKVVNDLRRSDLIIDEEEACIVRLVFAWYTHGDPRDKPPKPLSMLQIAKRLTRDEVPTRADTGKSINKRGKRFVAKKALPCAWSREMVRHILINESCVGTWHYGKTEMVSDGKEATRTSHQKRGLGKQVPVPREKWIAVKVPAIIDRELFDLAQARLAICKEQSVRNTKREYLMGRRLRCGKCGYTCVGLARRETNRYYQCRGAKGFLTRECDMPYFRADQVDNAVWQWICHTLKHPQILAAGLRDSQHETSSEQGTLRECLASVDAQITGNQEELSRLLTLYLKGEFSDTMLGAEKARIDKRATELARERRDLAAHLEEKVLTNQQIIEIEQLCAEIAQGLDNATFEDKRLYFDLLDVRGTLALEDGEKVVYARCKIGQQRVSLVPTSPSRCWHNAHTEPAAERAFTLTARLVLARTRPVSSKHN